MTGGVEGGGADRVRAGAGGGAGPPISFASVFEDWFETIFRYFARRVPRSDVPDLTAETFRLAHASWARFDPDRGSPRPWLYGIAANVLRHHQRSHTREQRALARVVASGPISTTPDDTDHRIDGLDAAQQWPEVAAALDHLADIDREALLLLAWEELSYGEIADATGVPVGTVRSRINRARRQVRERLGGDGQQGDDDAVSTPELSLIHI